jgi:putative nucleotidyltransferase with HDIG domain
MVVTLRSNRDHWSVIDGVLGRTPAVHLQDNFRLPAVDSVAVVSAMRAPLAFAARDLAHTELAGDVRRLRHCAGVARAAREIVDAVPNHDVDTLIAAAWLHDIGYGPTARATGFHPLDGARFLRRRGWPLRVCGLVAYHSGAYFVAEELGLDGELREFGEERGPLADALTYADQTTGPFGERLPLGDRMADMLRRHGPESANARAHTRRGPYLRAIAQRVESRLLARAG